MSSGLTDIQIAKMATQEIWTGPFRLSALGHLSPVGWLRASAGQRGWGGTDDGLSCFAQTAPPDQRLGWGRGHREAQPEALSAS